MGWDLHIRKVCPRNGDFILLYLAPNGDPVGVRWIPRQPRWRGAGPSIQEVSSVAQRIPPKAVRPPLCLSKMSSVPTGQRSTTSRSEKNSGVVMNTHM